MNNEMMQRIYVGDGGPESEEFETSYVCYCEDDPESLRTVIQILESGAGEMDGLYRRTAIASLHSQLAQLERTRRAPRFWDRVRASLSAWIDRRPPVGLARA